MTWSFDAIHSAYKRGDTGEFSHMIVSHTGVDFDQTATYVPKGQDPKQYWENSQAMRDGYGSIDEVYRYSLGWESQSKERRAFHWEMDEETV